MQGPARPHKDPTNHDFWNPGELGPSNQDVGSLCVLRPFGPLQCGSNDAKRSRYRYGSFHRLVTFASDPVYPSRNPSRAPAMIEAGFEAHAVWCMRFDGASSSPNWQVRCCRFHAGMQPQLQHERSHDEPTCRRSHRPEFALPKSRLQTAERPKRATVAIPYTWIT